MGLPIVFNGLRKRTTLLCFKKNYLPVFFSQTLESSCDTNNGFTLFFLLKHGLPLYCIRITHFTSLQIHIPGHLNKDPDSGSLRMEARKPYFK